jgi:hypothetical protein
VGMHDLNEIIADAPAGMKGARLSL